MTNRKTTKSALLGSAVALLLCFTMLLGTTFAWFTDTATTGVNKIQSGSLDVALEYATWDSEKETWTDYANVSEDESIFNEEALWEPGYTEVVKLRVTNKGNLALKYQLGMDVYSETGSTSVEGNEFKLSDYIKVGSAAVADVVDRASAVKYATKNINEAQMLNAVIIPDFGVEVPANILYPENSPEGIANENNYCSEWVFVIHMPEDVGNEANHQSDEAAPTITFGVNLVATQATYESDSFDNTYDKDATYPDAPKPKDPALNPDDGSTPENGDTYVDGVYTYTYDTDEGGWYLGKVSDNKQTTYAPILESINGEPVTLLYQTFLFCSNMTEAPVIPNGVQKLDMTFHSCSALTEAPVIPDSVTSIVNAFQYCTSLTVAPVIPDSVTSLNGAFNGCTALTTAPVIPANVTRLYDTFSGCTALTGTITINTNKIDNNTGYIDDGTCRECFKNVDMTNITLTGAASKEILNLIGGTGKNWTPIQ